MTINELNDLYSGDPLQTLLANFNKIYASKCYGGSLIEIGNRIVRHGLVTCNDDGESYYVPIEVECTAINYEEGEIIIAEVKNILENGDIYLGSENAAIILTASRRTIGAKPGDKLPIIVEKTAYSLYKKISVKGQIIRPNNEIMSFLVIADGPDFNVTDVIFEESVSKFLLEINDLSEKVNSLAKTNKKAVDFFRTKLQMRIDRKNQIMEITDIRAIKPGMVVSRGAQYTMTYSVYSDKLGNTRPANLRPVVLMLLAYVKLDLMNFCNLVEHYDAIKDLDFIWKSYHKDYKDE